jgi:type VI secretion system protein ImpM
MRCGLFGKLPAKRDFIALFVPRALLDVWEPWMQAAMSGSREMLKERWQQIFLTAPIWRFWLGAEICGTTVGGAFMPSLDGVGRYYPLTLFAPADAGSAIPPPDLDAQDDWFAAGEEFLLSALGRDVPYDATTAALDRLAAPSAKISSELPEGLEPLGHGTVAAVAAARPFREVCSALRAGNFGSTYAAASFWWTLGGGDYQPFALCCRGMPDPFLFTTMLTGRQKLETV